MDPNRRALGQSPIEIAELGAQCGRKGNREECAICLGVMRASVAQGRAAGVATATVADPPAEDGVGWGDVEGPSEIEGGYF